MSTATKAKPARRRSKGEARLFSRKTQSGKSRKVDFLKSPLFGMWKDYPVSVEDFLRGARKPRFLSISGDGPLR
jgi:hypothetical protein